MHFMLDIIETEHSVECFRKKKLINSPFLWAGSQYWKRKAGEGI